MHIQRNVSQKRLSLVALLAVFLLIAVGCGGPQSSPKAITKAYLDAVNSRRCSSLAALIDPADAGYGRDDTYAKQQIADCESYTEFEIDMAHLDVSDVWISVSASPADKANGFGDTGSVQIDFAVRPRGCADCRWEDRSCVLDLQQYKGKWWIVGSVLKPCLPSSPGGVQGVPIDQ
jgi:hypothetical protein